ncbi:hypothetical protein ACLOJK_037136 [Asimina triloba]
MKMIEAARCDLGVAIWAAGYEIWEASPCCHIWMEEDGHNAAIWRFRLRLWVGTARL